MCVCAVERGRQRVLPRVQPYLASIQRACVILSSAASLAPLYFSTLYHKRHDFVKMLLNIKCVLRFSLRLLFETFLILRRIRQDILINVKSLHVKYPLFSPDFNET